MYHHISEFPANGVAKIPAIPETDQCVEWTGQVDRYGYGRVSGWDAGRSSQTGAHRLSYLLHVGPIPEGLVIDHLCRNRKCINWRHLEAVTNAVNVSAERRVTRYHCPRGHEFTETNTIRLRDGRRACRVCDNARKRRWNHKHKAESAA